MKDDDLFKRGLFAYFFMTTAFWFMAWAMKENGAAWAGNPSWQLVSWLRALFTWIGVGGITLWVLMSILITLDAKRGRAKVAATEATQELERDARDLEWQGRRDKEHLAQVARQAEEKRQRDEKLRREKIRIETEKRERTADDAARAALKDF